VPPGLADNGGERADRVSTPDYPLLTVPGYELYQLAHLTSFAVDALARHRRAMEAKDRLAHPAPVALTTSADAADADPTLTRPPGGFPAAAAALPGLGARPPQDSAARNFRRAPAARDVTGRPAPSPSPSPSMSWLQR
jgi:hypothetical protein